MMTIASTAALTMLVLCCPGIALQHSPTSKSSASAPEIRGVVVEPGINRPVEGAEMLLFQASAPGTVVTANTYTSATALKIVKTDVNGAFRFALSQFGQYRVEAKKDGYRTAGALNRGVTSAATVNVTEEASSREVRLLLARPAEIRAVVVDEETELPVAGKSVVAMQLIYNAGQKRTLPAGFATTDKNGEFILRDLAPADYIVRLRVPPFGKERFVDVFTARDAELTDAGYEQPNGGLEQATAVTVRSSDRINLGVVSLRPVRFHRVRFSFPEGVCGAANIANVAIANTADGAYDTVADVPCTRDFLVKGLAPGAYRAEVFVREQDRDSQLRGSADFQVVDNNLNVVLALGRGIDVKGKMVLTQGASQVDWEQVQLRLPGVGGVLRKEDLAPIPINVKGEFQVMNLGSGDKRLEIAGLPKTCYLKEVLYNGRSVPRNRFRLDPNQSGHVLEAVIGDRPAALMGAVKKRDQPVTRPYVVAVPVEAQTADRYPLIGVIGDESGNYLLEGLPPGEYKVIGLPGESRPDLENPQILDALLANAKKLMLGPKSVQSLELESAEPR